MYYVLGAILGGVLASALQCAAMRVGKKSWWKGRSVCDACGSVLKVVSMVPVFSILASMFKSSCCKKKLSSWYLVVELFGVFGGAMVAHSVIGEYGMLSAAMIVVIVLFALYAMALDAHAMLVPVYGAIAVSVLLLTMPLYSYQLEHLVLAPAIGFSAFGIQYFLTKGKGIGAGDMWLGLFMGAALGWPNVIMAIGLGYIIGAIHAIALLVTKRAKRDSRVPLGAYLMMSTIIVLFAKDLLVAALGL